MFARIRVPVVVWSLCRGIAGIVGYVSLFCSCGCVFLECLVCVVGVLSMVVCLDLSCVG